MANLIKKLHTKLKDNSGAGLLEIVISIAILTIISSSLLSAFVMSARITRDIRIKMTCINLINKTVEEIRALDFVEVGTIGGDPDGPTPQNQQVIIGGIRYDINTAISWEVMDAGAGETSIDWDYKNVRVTVTPYSRRNNPLFRKTIETYVARESSQPALTGGNIKVTTTRSTLPDAPVPNVIVNLEGEGGFATRTVQTTSRGTALFLGLGDGNYKVSFNLGNTGMIMHPSTSPVWDFTISGNQTLSKDIKLEYPCQLRIRFLDITGALINMSTATGNVAITGTHGIEIIKTFDASDLDSSYRLPNDFISGLWPLGAAGEIGAYSVEDISIEGYQSYGCFADNGGDPETWELWDGKFDSPGTYKNIVCYIGKTPRNPGVATPWVNNNVIITGNHSSGSLPNLYSAQFISTGTERILFMNSYNNSEFSAKSMFFDSASGEPITLEVRNRARLTLHAGMVLVNGLVAIADNSNASRIGKIVLSAKSETGLPISGIFGYDIGGEYDESYGVVVFTNGVKLGDTEIVKKGAYYFKDGLTLPDDATSLIPITKKNFVDY